MSDLVIRDALGGDLEELNGIYNHYVRTTPISFDIEPVSMEARREWFSHYAPAGRHRLLVALRDDHVIGYASSSRFRDRPAYDTSVETSVYVAQRNSRAGVGTALYAALFEIVEAEDVHRAYAGVTLPNDASVRLHERFGFRQVALYSEQGRKFGRYWDVAWFERPVPLLT